MAPLEGPAGLYLHNGRPNKCQTNSRTLSNYQSRPRHSKPSYQLPVRGGRPADKLKAASKRDRAGNRSSLSPIPLSDLACIFMTRAIPFARNARAVSTMLMEFRNVSPTTLCRASIEISGRERENRRMTTRPEASGGTRSIGWMLRSFQSIRIRVGFICGLTRMVDGIFSGTNLFLETGRAGRDARVALK